MMVTVREIIRIDCIILEQWLELKMAWYFVTNKSYKSHEVDIEVKTETLQVHTVSFAVNTYMVRGGTGGTIWRQVAEDSVQWHKPCSNGEDQIFISSSEKW